MTTATKFASAPITKAVTDGSGRFTAILAAFGPPADWQNEIFDRGAFQQSILDWLARGVRVPVFWNHEANKPNSKIGDVLTMREVDEGLLIEGQLNLKNPLAVEVYEALLTGSLDSMSIGYRYGDSYSADDGRHIASADVIEATFTPTPAEPRARVLSVKRRSATKAEVGSQILAQLDDQFHQFGSWEPDLWTKLARRIKTYVYDPRCDVQDLREGVVAFIQSERDRVRWARQDREMAAKLDDALLRGKLDDIVAEMHVGQKNPWHVEERGGRHCVILNEDSSTVKCHDTREEAMAHMRALYAAEHDGKALEVVERVGVFEIVRQSGDYVLLRDGTPVGRRRTLGQAVQFAESLMRDRDLAQQVDRLASEMRGGKSRTVGTKSATDQFIASDKAAYAEEKRRDAELREAIVRAGEVPPTERQRDAYIQRQIQREMDEHERRAAERQVEIQREEIRDRISRDERPWMPGRDAYVEPIGAQPTETPRMTHPEPIVHDAPPADEDVTVRAPVSAVDREGVTIAQESAPLAPQPSEAGETVRVATGVIVAEVRTAQPTEEKFRIPAVPTEISRIVEQQQPIPSPTGTVDEPIKYGLTANPLKAARRSKATKTKEKK